MPLDQKQLRTAILILITVIAVLAILWFALLRTVYVPAYQNIREADASAIVAELDVAGIPYRLANGGHDILVPEDQAAEARVVVAGSSVSVGGTVGFELFNDSDMGLTEFAQKINFQRAMQGELSRTIMMMEGVEFARVHLAIPERSIFRAAQGVPTAAVSIEMVPGFRLSPARIGGVQQLVSSSVPGLAVEDVAVLDERGDLVSASVPAATGVSPVNERAALESVYAIKARKAIAGVLPSLRFDVEVSARPREAVVAEPTDDAAGDGEQTDVTPARIANRSTPERDQLALRVMVRTPQTLSSEERDAIETVLVDTLGLAQRRGDVLNYTTGALAVAAPGTTSPIAAESVPASSDTAYQREGEWGDDWVTYLLSRWTIIVVVLLGMALLVIIPRRRLSRDETSSFAEMLKASAAERERSLHG